MAHLINIADELKALAVALPDPIFVFNQEGEYVNVIGGGDPHRFAVGRELIGKDLFDVVGPDRQGRFLSEIRAAVKNKELRIIEYDLWEENLHGIPHKMLQQGCWYEGRIHPILNPQGEAEMVVWVPIDISARKRLEFQLKKEAETDFLTGAFNRRYLFGIMERTFNISKRYGNPLSILVLDVDHFKNINDQYGHAAGDEVLRALTRECKALLRKADVFARCGGEEFALLLPETDGEGAEVLAERLRKKIKAMEVVSDTHTMQCSVSIGGYTVDEEVKDFNHLFSLADNALYEAKNTGRNCVVFGKRIVAEKSLG
jgi:diguanylate cyclase (GGDEF)-like protein